MANTEGTGGAIDFDPSMLTPDTDQAKYDAALEAAFGPQVRGDGDGGTGTGTDDTAGDGTITPDPDINTTGADTTIPNTGASVEGEEGEGGEGGDQTSGAIGGDAADFAALFRNRYNRDPEPGELEGYIALAEWAAQLTPEQQTAINNALADPSRYVAPQYQQQNQQVSSPVEQVEDPEYAALVEEFGEDHPLIKKIKSLESATQFQANESIQQQQQRTLVQIQSGVETFHSKYEDLTPQELEQLQGAVAQSRIFPGFVQANNGDISRAMEAALDYAYWQNPTYRTREIEKQYAALEETKKADQTRKTKASSVTSTGGNGASRTTPPPKTNDDRWAAVAAGLGEAMNGQKE